MLIFNMEDGKQIQIDREAMEERILEGVLSKLDEAREKDPGMYSLLKGAVGTVMTFAKVDLKPPKGVNSLDYLIAHYISLGLNALEEKPLEVTGKVVDTDGETGRD